MIVVSDTSVIVNLAWLKKLNLLQDLYEAVVIPTAVWDEIVTRGQNKPGAAEIKEAEWISVKTPQNDALVKSFRQTLDQGESEAIALALELDAELLLMDEKLGRATAHHFGLNVIGLIGVLIKAKRRALIAVVRPDLDQLRNVAGFYVADDLYRQALHIAGELDET